MFSAHWTVYSPNKSTLWERSLKELTRTNSVQYRNSKNNNVQHFVHEAQKQALYICCVFTAGSVSEERKNTHVRLQ
jgi:pyruvate carboxylase